MLAVERAALEDPLHGFRYVQVGAAQRSEEWHDPVGEEPQHEVWRVMPGEVIPDQQHPQGQRSSARICPSISEGSGIPGLGGKG